MRRSAVRWTMAAALAALVTLAVSQATMAQAPTSASSDTKNAVTDTKSAATDAKKVEAEAKKAASDAKPAGAVKKATVQKKPAAAARKPAPKKVDPNAPDSAGLFNVAQSSLGATAKGSGSPINKDWPAGGSIQPENQKHGTMFGSNMIGGRIDIRLVVPVEIKAVEVVGLDYRGTKVPKAVDVLVDGKMITHAELPETPGQPFRIPVEAQGQFVSVVITDQYPVRDLGNGLKGPNWGGWERIRVMAATNVPEMMKHVDNYAVKADPANIAPTSGAQAGNKVEVFGQPRQTKGHPCTIWDSEDIAHYQEMLKTSSELAAQFAGLKKSMDERLTKPIGVPEPKQGPDGKWLHLPDTQFGAIHNQLGCDIANLGTAYVLSGDAKYAEFCKKLLMAYADAYPNYGIGARPGFNHDPSKAFDQRLGDATWLIQVARGYDLIYNLPSITPEERKHIEENLVKGAARHIMGNHAVMHSPTNWSAIATCSVLMAGYATDDQELITAGLYYKNKKGGPGTADDYTGGAYLHFGPTSIDQDGMWAEGAMGYQFMALEALVTYAEVAWHHGIDFYRHRDGAFKRLFDSPLEYSYPNLYTPALHDSGYGSIVGGEGFLYEFAYRRYRDPRYLLVLNQTGRHLNAQFQKFPVSVLYDRDPQEKVVPVEWQSVNLFGVGYGILRQTDQRGTNSLLLDYGPNRSHGHPDKLNVDLYAFGDRLMPDPGSIWYEQPLYRRWYHTTVAHNTLVVDENEQLACAAEQLVYAPADTVAMQRAWTQAAYAGVTMDRAVFLTPDYMADIFGAFARLPRKMDLAWHIRGAMTTDLKLEPVKLPEPQENGYNELANVRQTAIDPRQHDGSWSMTFSREGHTARLVSGIEATSFGDSPVEPPLTQGFVEVPLTTAPTNLIIGEGWLGLERPLTVIERRQTDATVYGNAIDISGAKGGYVKRVAISGSLKDGYAMMSVVTARGVDYCYAAYQQTGRPVSSLHWSALVAKETFEFSTDALQFFVTQDGPVVRAIYMAGGTVLDIDHATRPGGSTLGDMGRAKLSRSVPGLAYIEKAESGGYIVGNPSPTEATVKVTLKGLAGLAGYRLDGQGRRTGQSVDSAVAADGTVELKLAAGEKVEFAPKAAASAYDHRQEMLRQRQAAQEAALNKARDEAAARSKAREQAAKDKPVPAGVVVVVQAEDFSAEGGGKVSTPDNKKGAVGKAINQTDALGQWQEWTIEVPAEGHYNLTVCYCSDLAQIVRELSVNGEVQEPFAPLLLAGTGGWGNNADDWQIVTAVDPTSERPLLLNLKAGKNVLRLMNTNGRGANLDYLAVSSPDVKVTRDLLAAKARETK